WFVFWRIWRNSFPLFPVLGPHSYKLKLGFDFSRFSSTGNLTVFQYWKLDRFHQLQGRLSSTGKRLLSSTGSSRFSSPKSSVFSSTGNVRHIPYLPPVFRWTCCSIQSRYLFRSNVGITTNR